MKPLPKLQRFARRVRIVRAWRGAAIGACFGALGASVWAGLDWAGFAYTDWASMGVLVAATTMLGVAVGALLPISEIALARSIDRRAGLEDRLSTANERGEADGAFDEALHSDAVQHVQTLQPRKLYPIRVGRWHAGAVAFCAVAAALFLLGNTPVLLGEDARKTREELKKEGQRVERIAKENFETPEAQKGQTDAERRLAEELRRYQRELEKARMSKEEALQKANELAKKAEDLMRQKAEQTEQSLQTAEKALEKMQKEALDKQGLQKADPQLSKMSEKQLAEAEKKAQQQAAEAKKQLEDLKKKLADLDKKLKNPNLTPEQRKALEAQKQALQKQAKEAQQKAEQAQKQMESLKLSKEAQKALEKMMNDPAFKKLQEMAEKLKQQSKDAKEGKSPQMSDEQRKQLQKELEKLLEKLKDDKAMKEYLEAMMSAMQKAGQMGRMGDVAGQIPMQMPGQGGNGPDETSNRMPNDTGKVNHTDKPTEGKGNTLPTSVKGQQRDTPSETPYVEIKAPTLVGNRSSVPYTKVLPSYRKKAESALERQQIPKEHERRVKAYFESLGK